MSDLVGVPRTSPLLTKEGGIAIVLINKTGLPSVKGTVLEPSAVLDLAVGIEAAAGIDPIGIMYSEGIADGLPVLVVVSGIAEVLLEDGFAATRGFWAGTSDAVAGRAQSAINPPATVKHDQELGHFVESKNAGVDILAKQILHFR